MIYMSIPSLPPSSNNAYGQRGAKRFLKPEGKAYKIQTTSYIAQQYGPKLIFFKKDKPYLFLVRFWFEQIYNKGWPKTAESRYKRLDVSNRLKLFEDALKDAGGVDDSQNITLILDKREGKERTELWGWNLEEEQPPWDFSSTGG